MLSQPLFIFIFVGVIKSDFALIDIIIYFCLIGTNGVIWVQVKIEFGPDS